MPFADLAAVFYSLRDAAPGALGEGGAPSLQRLSERFGRLQQQASELSVPNEFGALLQRAGGVHLNASTSPDATRYFVSLPANALELWFALEAERFQVPLTPAPLSTLSKIHQHRQLKDTCHHFSISLHIPHAIYPSMLAAARVGELV